MPVRVDTTHSGHYIQQNSLAPVHKPTSRTAARPSGCVTIGLINNMPEAAFKATERQFISLLETASQDIPILLSLYALPGIQTESGEDHAGSRYASVETLLDAQTDTRLDGLIVTGREPTTPDLKAEAYWNSFTQVLEWAQSNTYSTVWSCLAAHAAILHMDGIGRRKSNDKHFGVFECALASSHRLTAGVSPRFGIPHSRWNGIAEEELAGHGYRILTRSANAGVDMFVKQHRSLFVFFQGHPEYESDTLLREYRRDIGRYIRAKTGAYPSMPSGYFDHSTECALTAMREQILSLNSTEALDNFASALEAPRLENTWRSTAVQIYKNWLAYICERKSANQPDVYSNAACPVSL